LRTQPTNLKTGSLKKRVIIFISIISTLAFTAAALFALLYNAPYNPPPFEPKALQGTPQPPDDSGYSIIDAAGNFTVGAAGNMQYDEDGSLQIYLTNPKENDVYIMCAITDAAGKTLYKSGLLRPGEYVVSFDPIIKQKEAFGEAEIAVKIYAFEPENYYSMGAITLKSSIVYK